MSSPVTGVGSKVLRCRRSAGATAEVKAALTTEDGQVLEIVQDNEGPEPFDEDRRRFGE